MNLTPREKDKLLIAMAACKAFTSEVGTTGRMLCNRPASREVNASKKKTRDRQ